jgi:hypothetical protein
MFFTCNQKIKLRLVTRQGITGQEAIIVFHKAHQNKNKITSDVPGNRFKLCTILSRVWSDCTGFGLVIGFIGHLQNVTTNNYFAIANSHTLQFTTARIKSQSVSSSVVTWWRIPTISSVSVLTFLPAGDCPTTISLLRLSTLNKLKSRLLLLITISARTA